MADEFGNIESTGINGWPNTLEFQCLNTSLRILVRQHLDHRPVVTEFSQNSMRISTYTNYEMCDG